MGIAFTVFWIIVAAVLGADFLVAIILCIIEQSLKKKHPDNEGEVAVEMVTTHVTGEDIYLQVKDGAVTIIDELPTVEVVVEKEVVKVKQVPVAAAVASADVVEAPVADTEEELDEAGRVAFIASEQKLTYLDKLAALEKNYYSLYEQLVNYLISKENVKMITTNNKGIFKYKTDRLVIASVRRGVVTLQFMLINSNLERYMRAEGAKQIKVTPVTIRLTNEDDLSRAKSTADLTIDYLEQERVYNAEQKKAARKEARRAKAAAAAAAAAAADNK